jgi:phosphatidylserine decarboxylase
MSEPAEHPAWRDRAFVGMQYLLPQHALSRIVRAATRSTGPRWKNFLIRTFLRHFDVSMTEAAEQDPFAYASFNAFFTRALRADARPLPAEAAVIVSPVDGTVSEAGAIDDDRLLQAKGRHYSLDALLAGDATLVAAFRGGLFATLYLAPYNYHRIHMPVSGRLLQTTYVPGRLFSVNTTTAQQVPGLFARNERVVCSFDTAFGRMALILVGALFVGSMATVWAGDLAAPRSNGAAVLSPPAQPVILDRGTEMGRFNMGSTVILLLPPGVARWQTTLRAGALVRMGEVIGTAVPASGNVRAAAAILERARS